MKAENINLKIDTDILSSRMGSQIGSSRTIFRIGQPAIYIAPKMISDENSYNEGSKENSSVHSLRFLEAVKGNQKEQAEGGLGGAGAGREEDRVLVFGRFHHFGVTFVEGLVFCGFLLGSFGSPPAFGYIDMAINFLCGLKIILLHTYIYTHNKTNTPLLEPPNPQPGKLQPQPILYLNKLQAHELLQFWSMLCTALLCLFSEPLAINLICMLRLARLFFPFVGTGRTRGGRGMGRVWAVVKVGLWIVFGVGLIGIGVGLFMYNIDNYYCLSTDQLASLTQNTTGQPLPHPCSLTQPCPTPSTLSCLNIYSLTTTNQQKQQISTWLHSQDKPQLQMGQNLLATMWMVMEVDGGLYGRYRGRVMEYVLLPGWVGMWVVGIVLAAVAVGDVLRDQNVYNYQHQHRHRHTSQPQTPPLYPQQLSHIQTELSSRTLAQKLSTILFNSVYLLQVILTILYNMEFQDAGTLHRDVGISLGVIFIVWSFGLGLAGYQWLTDPQKWTNKVKIYTLLFQTCTYSLTLSDYLLRISLSLLLFQSSTGITPFAQSALSLRIIFILYNNGFDAQISLLCEKVLENFMVILSSIGMVLAVGVVAGFGVAIWGEGREREFGLQGEMVRIVGVVGRMLGFDVGVLSKSQMQVYVNVCLKFVGIFLTIYISKTSLIAYSKALQLPPPPQLPSQQYPLQLQSPNTAQQHLHNLYTSPYYTNFLIALLLIYTGISWFLPGQDVAAVVLFVGDCLLAGDVVGRIGVYGVRGYLEVMRMCKIGYVCTQIYLLVSFFVPQHIHPGLTNSLHLSRSFLLLSLLPSLNQPLTHLKTLLFSPSHKLYKLPLLALSLSLTSACSLSLYLSQTPPVTTQSNPHKISQLIGTAVAYVLGLKWVGLGAVDGNASAMLCLEIVGLCVVGLLEGVFVAFGVGYFVGVRGRSQGSQGSQGERLLRDYSKEDPREYYYQPTSQPYLYSYVKALKVIIILISFILLALLSGPTLQHSPLHSQIATLNLILNLLELFLYILENSLLKSNSPWPKLEALLLLVSLPGSFFLIFPVIRFGGYLELSMLIRVFLGLAMVRLGRIYGLGLDRAGVFSSRLLRRIDRAIGLESIVRIFGVWFVLTLPFAVLVAELDQTDINTQLISLLTGSTFIQPITPASLAPKILYSLFIHYPLRILLISRTISNLLPTHYSPLTVLQDRLEQLIAETGMEMGACLKVSQVYRFCARVDREFRAFYRQGLGQGNGERCRGYEEVMGIVGGMDIDVYSVADDGKGYGSTYVIFAYDIIWHFLHYYRQKDQKKPQISSLYPLSKQKKQNISRSHIKMPQYHSLTKIKPKLYKKIRQLRDRNLQKIGIKAQQKK